MFTYLLLITLILFCVAKILNFKRITKYIQKFVIISHATD